MRLCKHLLTMGFCKQSHECTFGRSAHLAVAKLSYAVMDACRCVIDLDRPQTVFVFRSQTFYLPVGFIAPRTVKQFSVA